jgi:hypothetical protein
VQNINAVIPTKKNVQNFHKSFYPTNKDEKKIIFIQIVVCFKSLKLIKISQIKSAVSELEVKTKKMHFYREKKNASVDIADSKNSFVKNLFILESSVVICKYENG